MARKKNIAEELVASMREASAHAAGKPVKVRIGKARKNPARRPRPN